MIKSNQVEMGGTTVRFYLSYVETQAVARALERSVPSGSFRPVHVQPFGYLIEDLVHNTLSDREGRLPEVIAKIVRLRIKVPA